MANGRLGDRIKNWLDTIIPIQDIFKFLQALWTSWLDWRNMRTKDDMRNFVAKYGNKDIGMLSFRARQMGFTEEEMQELFSPVVPKITEDPSVWIGNLLQGAMALPAWQELNEIFGAVVFDPWLASMVRGEIDPNAPEVENVRRFLGTQATFEGLGSMVSLLGEIISVGQVENAGKMFTDAKWLLGTCFTSWQTTSPIVESVILRPLQRLVNLTFRETDFTRTQWMDLYDLGKISAARLGEELGRLGFDSEKIAWLVDLAERQPSRSDLVGMWNKGLVDDGLVADGFRRLGYSEEWIDRFLIYYKKEETSEEKGAYLGTLRKAFKEQMISEIDFRDALKQQGRSDTAINLEIAVLKLSWEVDDKTAAKSDIRAAYFEDVIGRPEAEKWLGDAGFDRHTITLLMQTWDKTRAPTYRKINKSEILKAWGFGVLTQNQTYQALLDVGYNEHGATVLMDTYRKAHLETKPPTERELRATDVMWAWHSEVIEEGEVIDRLLDLGYTAKDAGLLFETFQRIHPRVAATPPKELKKNDILEAWGRGVLDSGDALIKLVALDYPEETAIILMDTYALRPEALPPEPGIAALVGATRRGIITQAALSQKLTVMGLKAEDVQFYVSYAVTPLPEKTRSLSRTDITKLWSLGRHDRAWAIERLLALNYSPEDIEDILWLASPEIEDTETFILWSAGVITDAVAIAMWTTMGFTPEQIAAVMGGG